MLEAHRQAQEWLGAANAQGRDEATMKTESKREKNGRVAIESTVQQASLEAEMDIAGRQRRRNRRIRRI